MTPKQKAKLKTAYVISLDWMLKRTPKTAIIRRPEIVKVKDESK